VRGTLAEREWAPPREAERRPDIRVVRRPARRRGLGLRQRPGVWLVAFAVCLALLAVGRVTLSFTVVQKNMQTEAMVRQQRAVQADNVRLQEEIARLAATPRLRRLAIERHGLVPAQGVIYLDGGQAAAGEAAVESLSGQTAEPGAP